MASLPFSRFFFTHQVDPIIGEAESNVEIGVASNSMVFQGYDPPPSRAYVHLLEEELVRTVRSG